MLLPIIMILVCVLLGGGTLLFLKFSERRKKAKSRDKEELAQMTANEFVNVKDIRGSFLYTRDGMVLAYLKIFPISTELFSKNEKRLIAKQLTASLSSGQYPFQLLAVSRPVDISPLMAELSSTLTASSNIKQKELLKHEIVEMGGFALSGEVVERQFYIKIWDRVADGVERDLLQKLKYLAGYFADCGIQAEILEQQDIVRLCNLVNNPAYRRGNGLIGGVILAIDPLTAKLLVQAAARAAADEESRRRTLILILAPILGLLLLIAFILYLITSPFSMLSQWLVGDEVNVVENFQKEYGYNQQLGIYEKDYIEGSGQSYESVVFTDGGREVIYYNQLDERWADTMYGTSGTIGEAGCGPTAMAIVTSTLTGTPHDPVELSEWSVANGHRCEGNGSYHSLIPAAAEAYGLSWESVPPDDPQAMVDALADGKLVVAIMAKGHFTNSGHFIVLRGVTAEGKILVADPASHKRSEQEWDLSIILDEARKGAAAGGPFWAIY